MKGSLHLVALAVPDLEGEPRHTGDGRYVLIAPSGLWDAATPSAGSPELDFRVTFPGPVIETDPAASVDGSTVSWTAPSAPGRGLGRSAWRAASCLHSPGWPSGRGWPF